MAGSQGVHTRGHQKALWEGRSSAQHAHWNVTRVSRKQRAPIDEFVRLAGNGMDYAPFVQVTNQQKQARNNNNGESVR